MSHVRSLSAVLLGLHIVGRTYAQINVTVEESDAALVYTPFKSTWDSFGNPQTRADGTVDDNYFHGGNCLAIKLPGATVSLTFNGSYIAYYSDMMNNHGSMSVTLDGKITTLNTFNAAGGTPQVKLFESFVDPNTPNHTITLTCLETKNMGLDYFLYTAATPTVSSSVTSSIESSSSSPSTSSSPSAASSSTSSTGPGIIVAAVVAAIGWAVAFIFAFLLLRMRRRRATTTAYPQASLSQQSSMPATSSVPVSMYGTEPLFLAPPSGSGAHPAVTGKAALMRGLSTPSVTSGGGSSSSGPALSTRASVQSPPAYSEDR